MTIDPYDDLFAQHILRSRIITSEQLEAARAEQSHRTANGENLSLAAVLVRQGMLTEAILENVGKSMQEVHKAGIQTVGQYKLLRKLGEGGMGAVYLADDTVAERQVAIKMLPKKYASRPEFLARFKREAKSAGRLNHENVVAAYTTGEEKGNHFYVMEYCEGEPLDKILKREKRLDWDKAVDYTLQIARGLNHAHNLGIIHRDVKPSNIFITERNVAKILDMGLSKNIADSEQSFNTVTGMALGTPHYISPEQAKGEKDIDGRTDIYSLGATLYHLVTGETPFQGGTPAVVMMKHLNERLPNPQDIFPEIPDGIVRVIQKMMTKDASDRYRNCADLIADLDLVADGHNPINADVEEDKTSVRMRAVPRTAIDQAKVRKATVARIPARPRQNAAALRPPPPLKKSYLPLYLSVFAGLAALILIALVIFGIKKPEHEADKKSPAVAAATTLPQTTVSATATPVSAPPSGVAKTDRTASNTEETSDSSNVKAWIGTGEGKENPNDPARWKHAVDLLKLVDPVKNKVGGTWKRQDMGGLAGFDPYARIEFPYQPPEEYDVRLVFMLVGRNAPLYILLPRGKTSFACVMGLSNAAGVENIYGKDLLGQIQYEKGQSVLQLLLGVHYTAICQVRGKLVRLIVNGETIFVNRATDEMLSRNESWKLIDNRLIGLGTAGDGVAIDRFEVLDVKGKGAITRPDNLAAKEADKKHKDSDPGLIDLESLMTQNAYIPFDLSSICNADVISTETHVAADSFKSDVVSSWTTAGWLRANEKKERKEAGLPDDGIVKIPKSTPSGSFKLALPPAKNAVLITPAKGKYPKPAELRLPENLRRKYSQLAFLHAGSCGDGRVHVVLKYTSGKNDSVSLKIEDWHPQYRLPLALTEKVAASTLTTRNNPAEMCAQIVPADPARVLDSIVFSFEPIDATAAEEVPHDDRFTAGVFAVSGQPAADKPVKSNSIGTK